MLVLLYFCRAYLKVYIHQTHSHLHIHTHTFTSAFLFAFFFYSCRRAPALPLKYLTRSSLGVEFEFYAVCAFFLLLLLTAIAIILLRCRLVLLYMLHYL